MLQGGPHNASIAALAVQLKEVATPEFKEYSKQIIKNAQALQREMVKLGLTLQSYETANHLLLWDVRPHGLTGAQVEKVLEKMNISTNKNQLTGDKSALNPGGIRLGTPALTTRGFTEEDMAAVAAFLKKGIDSAKRITDNAEGDKSKFNQLVETDTEVLALKEEVATFAR